MESQRTGHCSAVVGYALLLSIGWPALSSIAKADDWPAYRHDRHRSAVTDGTLNFPLQLAWRYACAQPPAPAWPPPPRLLNKLDFDYAAAPVIAAGLVCFGSSADDTVRALDLNTGALRWQFTAGGPVRFAPQIVGSRVFFAADDGWVYCLDAATGRPAWTFRAAPEDEQFIGNRRMISRWPCRNGVLVADGVLYCVAGIWPSEGIYVYALDAETGAVRWCNDTSGLVAKGAGSPWHTKDPHSDEFSMSGLTPQGPLLASRDTLIVPLANNSPAAFNLLTGKLLRFVPRGGGSGNQIIDSNLCYSWLQFRSGLELFGSPVADKDVKLRGVRYGGPQLPQISIFPGRLPFQRHERGKVSVIFHEGKPVSRRAYGLALAGGVLLEGHDGSIAAVELDGNRELWRATVRGEAREIAVAAGRSVVSTSAGEISCFAPGTARPMPASAAPAAATSPDAVAGGLDPTCRRVRAAGMDRGYALVLGDPQGRTSLALAAQTNLHVVNALADPAASELRQRLLATTNWYGSRIHVVAVPQLDRLPFAQYFANAVVVAGDGGPDGGLSARELYRVLRPCGGVLLCTGLEEGTTRAWLKDAGAPAGELRPIDGATAIVRGPLPGARDWNANTAADQRVRWPLRPIWFGGPDPSLVMNVGIGAHPPVAADGRYFVTGNDCLTAVDAYNGAVLWSRPIPSATPGSRFWPDGLCYSVADSVKSDPNAQWTVLKRWLAADGHHVYLRLGQNYLRGGGEAYIQMDAANGRQKRIYGPWTPPPQISLRSPQTWPIELDDARQASVTMQQEPGGLVVTLTAPDAVASPADAWDLFLDLRPADQRFGLYERGTFMITVLPSPDARSPARAVPGTGDWHPQMEVSGTRTAEGTQTTVRLSWPEFERLTGRRPDDFGFAATLDRHDGGEREQVVQHHLFGDAVSPGMNNGWANVSLSPAAAATPAAAPVIVAGELEARPGDWPFPVERELDQIGDPGRIDATLLEEPRPHPLTGEPGPRLYRAGTGGCGNPVYSAACAIGRSTKSALGFYDFAEDAGLHFFPGIPVNCGARTKAVNMTAALGLLVFSESRSHCECMIPLRTSLAFAPAERRLHEDWALFSERAADAPIRDLAVNFGAFGDRRDDAGVLWLTFPREGSGRSHLRDPMTRRYLMETPPIQSLLPVPVQTEGPGPVRPFRLNADRTVIAGTDRPWIYASGVQNLRTVTVVLQPRSPLAATATQEDIRIDGMLGEPTWGGDPQANLAFTNTELRLRFDAQHLYVGVRRPAVVGRRGEVTPWTRRTAGSDASVWEDDSVELFLGRAAGPGPVVHLALSASGARYDALAGDAGQEDITWNGDWTGGVQADETGLSTEWAIPWSTLTGVGLKRDSLGINLQVNQQDVSAEAPAWHGYERRSGKTDAALAESLLSLGAAGRSRCAHLVAFGLGSTPAVPPRRFTVRLHFAEVLGAAPGKRVFDLSLQGQVVAKNLDVAQAAGGQRTALVSEFRDVAAAETLVITFTPKSKDAASPMLSGLEVHEER